MCRWVQSVTRGIRTWLSWARIGATRPTIAKTMIAPNANVTATMDSNLFEDASPAPRLTVLPHGASRLCLRIFHLARLVIENNSLRVNPQRIKKFAHVKTYNFSMTLAEPEIFRFSVHAYPRLPVIRRTAALDARLRKYETNFYSSTEMLCVCRQMRLRVR